MRSLSQPAVLALIAAMFAAGPVNAATLHTVPWYVANADARTAMIAACRADPGDLATTPDCVNATAAENQVTLSAL